MGQGEMAKIQSVVKVPGVGWRVKSNSWFQEGQWELEDAQTPVAGTDAPGMFQYYANREQSLSGVTSSGERAAQSGLTKIKRVAAGESWEKRLTADQTAYPGPPALLLINESSLPISTVALDRVFVASAPHEPNDGLSFNFAIPTTVLGSIAGAVAVYFCGPAGLDIELDGFGQYCLIFSQGGLAVLWERGMKTDGESPEWAQRTSFRFASNGRDAVILRIQSDCILRSNGRWEGRVISFMTNAFGQNTPPDSSLTAGISAASRFVNAENTAYEYKAPNASGRAITLAPMRVDARRDLRISYGLYRETFQSEGVLEDQPIDLGILPVNGGYLYLDAYHDTPTGTDITYELKAVGGASDGSVLTGTTVIQDDLGRKIRYTLPNTVPVTKQYRLKATFATDTLKSPTLRGYVLSRDPLFEAGDSSNTFDFPSRASGTAVMARAIEHTSISGPSMEPASESANVRIIDLTGELPQARTRTGTPVDIDILNDSNTLISRLFRGVVQAVGSSDLPPGKHGYPGDDAFVGEVSMAGMFRVLNRRLAPARIALWDSVIRKPLKVTDAIKLLLRYAGVNTTEMVIPDYPIRLLGSEESDNVIEPDTPLGEIIQSMASDYLGGAVYYCPNTGEGAWRLLRWPRPAYNVVARFDPYHPNDNAETSNPKLRHLIGSYDSVTAVNGQVIQCLGTTRPRRISYEPPEGNCVVVIGGASEGSNYGVTTGANLVQLVVNTDSYDALGLGSGHAKYPDVNNPDFLRECVPIVVRDGTLSTPDAVNFVARRVFDAGCHAREVLTFRSLLPLFWDVTDASQTRARPPRFGDMVEVRQKDGSWKLYCISKCSPDYSKSHNMTADYELVRTSLTDSSLAVPIRNLSPERITGMFALAVKRSLGFGTTRQIMSGNAAGSYMKTRWGSLPAASLPPIQELDPASADYGKFYFMAGYDPVP